MNFKSKQLGSFQLILYTKTHQTQSHDSGANCTDATQVSVSDDLLKSLCTWKRVTLKADRKA